jgi:hypothetical protein
MNNLFLPFPSPNTFRIIDYNKINYQDTILLMVLYTQTYSSVNILIKFTSKLILTLLFYTYIQLTLEECFTNDSININDKSVNMTQNGEKVFI